MKTLRMVGSSLRLAALQVRAWFLGYLLVTLTAAFLVWPALSAMHAAFDHAPSATLTLGESLDADFARTHPWLAVQGGGAVLLVLLGWTFLGGGVLATAGRRVSMSAFLGECGKAFWPGVKVLAAGLVPALLLAFGVGRFDAWLRAALAGSDPGSMVRPLGLQSRWFTLATALEILRWCYGYLFLCLLLTAKVARAHLLRPGSRSAVVAWLRAVWTVLRHPWRADLSVFSVLFLWIGSGFVFGWILEMAEGKGWLWMSISASQIHVAGLQILLIAHLLIAKRLAGIEPVRESSAPADVISIEDLPDEPLLAPDEALSIEPGPPEQGDGGRSAKV
ncbi:MAG: hypothetical protein Fur0037_05780 [Planctomycetota bacterium]